MQNCKGYDWCMKIGIKRNDHERVNLYHGKDHSNPERHYRTRQGLSSSDISFLEWSSPSSTPGGVPLKDYHFLPHIFFLTSTCYNFSCFRSTSSSVYWHTHSFHTFSHLWASTWGLHLSDNQTIYNSLENVSYSFFSCINTSLAKQNITYVVTTPSTIL